MFDFDQYDLVWFQPLLVLPFDSNWMVFHQTAARLSNSVKKPQSKLWVARQLRDPYMQKRLRHPAAYRSRSAFKLLEIADRYDFLAPKDVNVVVDLGAAPGGWSQVIAGKFGWRPTEPDIPRLSRHVAEENDSFSDGPETLWSDSESTLPLLENPKLKKRKGANPKPDLFDPLNIDNLDLSSHSGRGTIIAVDLKNVVPIPGVQTVKGDFLEESTVEIIRGLLFKANEKQPKVDVILSDMAANITGNDVHDSQSSLDICEAVFRFVKGNLRTAESCGNPKGGVLL